MQVETIQARAGRGDQGEAVTASAAYRERSWQDFWEEGSRYLEIAGRAFPGNGRFTPEIIYHMVGMGLEGLFMAWLGQEGNLPENHTVRDLVRAAEKLESFPPDLRRSLWRFDRFMGLCSLEPVPIPPPAASDVPEMLDTARRTQEYLEARYRPRIKGPVAH